MPFFSIIIPVYNSQQYIGKCLEKIRGQDFSDYEIIIQDGLSTDSTLRCVEAFTESYPAISVLVQSEKDNGIYDAMNHGAKRASGEWLLFMGSDDELYDENVLKNISSHIRTLNVDMLYGNVLINGNSHWAKHGEIYAGEFTREKLFLQNICHQAIFYNKRVFKTLGYFNERYRVCADWDFNHRCFAALKTSYIPMVVSIFYLGGASSSLGHDDFTDWESVVNLKHYYKLSFFNKLFSTYPDIFSNAANKYLNKNRYFKSIYYFLFSFYHSNQKRRIIKNYLVNIYIYVCKKLRFKTA